jgi:2-iminobutanoate/2-iminopropanoate deaminase
MSVTYSNPPGLSAPIGLYSHIARTGGLVFIAGQLAVDERGEVVGAGEFEAQMRQVFHNVGVALAAEGMSFTDIAQMTTYLVGAELVAEFYRVRESLFERLFPDGSFPPNTLLVISRLVRPEFLIEVQVVAAS